MLNFLISIIAFSLAVYVLNRIFNAHAASPRSITWSVMIAATLFSIGVGWAVDKLDGDAELHKKDPSMVEIIKSGDPVKIVKLFIGFN